VQQVITRRYLLDELVRFRRLFGELTFWRGAPAAREGAVRGLFYTYLNAQDLTEGDMSTFQATMDEYRMRELMVQKISLDN